MTEHKNELPVRRPVHKTEDLIPRLGVNIDHIATLRELRGTPYPDLVEMAKLIEKAGAEQITVHLREDRRHIQDQDVKDLRKNLKVPMNLEMAVSEEIIRFACRIKPQWACLVPEKRREVTTEGGIDLKRNFKKIHQTTARLQKAGIRVSLFIEPTKQAVQLSADSGADAIELHTGRFALETQKEARRRSQAKIRREVDRILEAGKLAQKLGLRVNAGHGLDYQNIRPLVDVRDAQGQALIREYNIGHSIVCRAAMVGIERAVREMVSLVQAP